MLNNFAKSDREWLEPLLGAIAKAAPDLAEGANDKFQSFVAHAMHMEAEAADERPEPAPRKREDALERRERQACRRRGPLRQASPLVRLVMVS